MKLNKRNLKSNKAITLIALVITIIVLLILAGVTIATLTGDNRTINKSIKFKGKERRSKKARVNTIGYISSQD